MPSHPATDPGEDAIGKQLYTWGEEPYRVVGVVEHLIRPNEQGGRSEVQLSMILPIRVPFTLGSNYILRTDPDRREEVLKAAIAQMPHGRPMQPSEVAAWVGFLVSPAGDIASGNVIILNQGRDVR